MVRTVIMISIALYLLILAFFLSSDAMGSVLSINHDSEQKKVGESTYSVFGFELYKSEGLSFGNLVNNIAELPLPLNTIFIIFPSTILFVLVILSFVPFVSSD